MCYVLARRLCSTSFCSWDAIADWRATLQIGAFPAARRHMKNGISLLLIEDNRLLRNGIAAMIAKQPDLRLTAALPRLDLARLRSPDIRPDIVLLDAALPNHDSPGAVRTVKLVAPHAKVIVMGLLATQDDIVEFVKAGASGFILKDATFADFARTIRAVARGENVLPRATSRPASRVCQPRCLTQGVSHEADDIDVHASPARAPGRLGCARARGLSGRSPDGAALSRRARHRARRHRFERPNRFTRRARGPAH